MTTPLPPRAELKAQARRLRAAMAETATPLSQSQALEAVARQHGLRDWNTASALAPAEPAARWQVGGRVRGRYLGQDFTGRIKAARESGAYWHLTIVFDQPVDVVTSPHFSNLRRQVNGTLNGQGVTAERTSDGTPHLVVFAA
jgi:uncharacterized protein YfaS (alpha-2-macroglobulin family)